MTDVRGILVFTADDMMAFRSADAAAGYMEAVDVEEGEYTALFTLDGRRVTAEVGAEDIVVITVTEDRDKVALHGLLEKMTLRMRLASPSDDPVSIANELLRWEWEHRWPRPPAWLAKRLRPVEPPSL